MKCPVDQTQLVISDRQGIEIDYCPDCRGVWLDRGELDKLIDRSADYQSSPQPERRPEPSLERRSEPQSYDTDRNHGSYQKPHKKKRESFLGEIFDF